MADAKLVVELRKMTGAGIMDAKAALIEAGDNIDKAIEILNAKGLLKAASKGARETHEGVIHAYIHAGGKVGALVELACETDFVARTEQFQELAHDIAMHVAATDPLYVNPESVPPEVLEKEKSMIVDELTSSGKPPEMIAKIVEGKLSKYYSDVCLLNQPFVKDEDVTVGEYVAKKVATIGENIQVRRFVRMSMG